MIWNTYGDHTHAYTRCTLWYIRSLPRRICRYPRCVLQRNSANHSRAYSDACHNERRATFCFGPVGRKYRPFWIFNFQRSSKPLRAPPPSTFPSVPSPSPRSPLAARRVECTSKVRVRKSVGCALVHYTRRTRDRHLRANSIKFSLKQATRSRERKLVV